jgi:ankyrin repeat protein
MDATSKGELSRIRDLLAAGARLTDKDDAGDTVLMKAAANGRVVLVHALLIRGLSPLEKNLRGETALMKAAANGHAEVVQALLNPEGSREIPVDVFEALGVDPDKVSGGVAVEAAPPDEVDQSGQTALMKAAAGGHVAAVRRLRTHSGVKRDRTDNGGRSALVLAAAGGHADVVREFAGSNHDDAFRLVRPDEQGGTVLIRAAAKGDAKTVKAVLALNQENWFRNAQHGGKSFLDQKDKDGKTALRAAEEGNHAETVALLKEYVAVNGKDADGRTPLMKAAEKGDEAAVRDLLAKGADLTPADAEGRTALILAAAKGHADAVNALLGSLMPYGDSTSRLVPGQSSFEGPEPAEHANLKDKQGRTALQWAKDGRRERTLEVMKAYGIQ